MILDQKISNRVKTTRIIIKKSFQYLTWGLWGLLSLAYLISDRNSYGQMFGLWPAWFWILGIWLLILLAHQNRKQTLILCGAWLGFLLYFSEEWKWVFYPLKTTQTATWDIQNRTSIPDTLKSNIIPLRIITYNLSGDIRAMEAAAALHPDICFFQESPSSQYATPERIKKFDAKMTYYDNDGLAILSRYPAKLLPEIQLGWGDPAQLMEITLPGKRIITIVNVRLIQPELGLNPFSSSTWIQTKQNQVTRDKQMKILLNLLKEKENITPVILAGDFNRPARAASLNIIRKHYIDTFAKSGRGWGNTMTVDFPVSRIDMIWVSPHFKSILSRAVRTPYSDHRMVISDVEINTQDGI
jgi:endonuclease/exonuclease/phosphatase (EEP) superfamily protein YafD